LDGLQEEIVTGFVSVMYFRPMDDGDVIMRLAGTGRLAIALLDLINQLELVQRRSLRE
jgi:hypothetical protein